VVGVGSLLIGVGLVVWLGSMALPGSTGGSDTGSGPDPSVPVTLAETGEPIGAELAIAPDAELAEAGQVSVTGRGFAPGAIELVVCLTAPLEGGLACADDDAVRVRLSEPGAFDRALEIRRVVLIGDTAYDCATRAGACVLRTRRAEGPPDRGLAVPLAFAAGLAPVDAVPAPG
jgi:hypothetical protein